MDGLDLLKVGVSASKSLEPDGAKASPRLTSIMLVDDADEMNEMDEEICERGPCLP